MALLLLQWALEHEAREACFVVLAFFSSIARRLGSISTLVAEKLRRACGHSVLWAREGLGVRTFAVGWV